MKRYLVDNDGDGHWYLMPTDVHEKFAEFTASEGELDQPDGVVRLGGHPNNVTFTAPEEFGAPITEGTE